MIEYDEREKTAPFFSMLERYKRILRRHRPFILLVVFFVVAWQLFTTLSESPTSLSGSSSSSSSSRSANHAGLEVTLVNWPRYHFEVVAPLLFALSNQGSIVSSLEMFASTYGSTRLGVRPVLEAQMPKPTKSFWGSTINPIIKKLTIRELKELENIGYQPDVMVLTSCSRDLEELKNPFYLDPSNEAAAKEIICVLHEAEEWQEPDTRRRKMLAPWIEAGRVTFLVLSPHIGEYVTTHITKDWNMATLLDNHRQVGVPGVRLMNTFVPVFEDAEHFLDQPWGNITGPFAAIPGKYEPMRRNYGAIFDHMKTHLPVLEQLNGTLRLTGYGDWPPKIPDELSTHVYMHDHYMFPQYFSLLSQAMAMLPAFATHKYFEDRASSTIATSVIAGVPLVATKELLSKYSYLEEDGAWVQEEGEEEIMTWLRVLMFEKKEWMVKKNRVKALRKRLIANNLKLIHGVFEDLTVRLEQRARAKST